MPAETITWPLVGRHEELERCAETLTRGTSGGLVFQGPAGVGKSRLAQECLARAEIDGRATARAGATVATHSVPLGALVHLLPPAVLDRAGEPLALFGEVATALRERSPERPFVLLVDDLPLLDAASVVLLAQLLDAGALFLLATARSTSEVPVPIADLLRRPDLERRDLGELGADAVDSLLHLALGGPVAAEAVAAISRISGGNALFVRELVTGALQAGRLESRRGVWWLTGPLVGTSRLVDLIGERISSVTGLGRDALDLLALWQPCSLGDLLVRADTDVLEALERQGLIQVRLDDRREEVRLAHPLYAESLDTAMPTLTRRRLLSGQADRIESLGARRREDPLRIATARLDARGSADPDLLVAAARLARFGHDHSTVVRLARGALAEADLPDARLLLAESLHELGSYAEVEDLLAAGEVPDDEIGLQLVAMRVRNLVFGLQRHDDALTVNQAARERFTDVASRDELATDVSTVLLYADRPREALEALGELSVDPTPRVQVLVALTEAPALTSTGRCQQALAVSERAHRVHMGLGDEQAIAHPGIHHVFRLAAMIEAGRLTDAEILAAQGHAAASQGGPPIGRIWWTLGLGRIALLQGKPLTARQWLGEAASVAQRNGFDGPRRRVLSYLAAAHATLGDGAGARAAVDELDDLPPYAFMVAEQELGRAWRHQAEGDPEGARSVLHEAARRAEESGHLSTEAWLLHDLARLGGPEPAAERLAAVDRACEGDLVPAFALHARGLARQDGDVLAEATSRFVSLGTTLFAAEAATAAAHAYERSGQARRGAGYRSRAAELAAHCEGARTPGLASPRVTVPLTAREREVALLAADGLQSKDIAARLYLSVRTVDNHLQRIYVKLGVGGRAELADVLALGDRS